MKQREVVIEVLVPRSEQQNGAIGDGMNLSHHMLPERTDTEAELCEGGIAWMTPGPGGRYQQDDPEGRMTYEYLRAEIPPFQLTYLHIPKQENNRKRDSRLFGADRQQEACDGARQPSSAAAAGKLPRKKAVSITAPRTTPGTPRRTMHQS